MRACFLVLLLLVAPSALFAFWPVYWELGGEKNLLGPLVSYEREGDKTHLTVRPLLSSYDSPDTYSILFPLGRSTENRAYFAPLYAMHRLGNEYDVALFPVFHGKTKEERSYGGVFPFYGKLYDRFRRDELGFVLWPFYSYSVGEGTTKTNILWPLFSFSHGRQEGFKLGPFYGRRRIGDERVSSFVLWPFYIKDDKDLNTDNPKHSVFAVPFYMRTTSPNSSFFSVMWPFFTYMRVPQRMEVKAPWPFFSYGTGKEEKGTTAWPIYSHWFSGKDEITYALWPLYKETERYVGDEKWTLKRVLLIDKYEKDNRGTFFNICPFFEYRRGPAETAFFFPSIIPWRDPGFDRIVRPLLTLYEYRKKGDATTANFLYGFYTKEQQGDCWKRRLAFLLQVERRREGMGFEVLSGLFGLDPDRIKLFYVPLRRRNAEETAAGEYGEATPEAADGQQRMADNTDGQDTKDQLQTCDETAEDDLRDVPGEQATAP